MNRPAQTSCGRGLAPDSYLTGNDDVDWHTAIGSKSNRRTAPPTLIVLVLGDRHG